ncbi:PepSY domain-containing protein [Sphingomonas sp. NFR15]|uniref:PepSY domain-containing protein n=1 Tax=Sphingomonas sp. NFR15 TaxID=1566282 RepID=UPI00087FC4A5|nr:PepSY domain-containing protein [Sphingomonas sp. NFR15]SDA22309.1 Peptidase propeptide and YPEB domain-containing protein [Sphingomonas sp. NFR15]
MKPATLFVMIAMLGAAAAPADAAKTSQKPKITMAAARAIALRRAPGDVKAAEYEFENGGWRYSFDIGQGGRIHEIGVDAASGKVVEDAYENPSAKD